MSRLLIAGLALVLTALSPQRPAPATVLLGDDGTDSAALQQRLDDSDGHPGNRQALERARLEMRAAELARRIKDLLAQWQGGVPPRERPPIVRGRIAPRLEGTSAGPPTNRAPWRGAAAAPGGAQAVHAAVTGLAIRVTALAGEAGARQTRAAEIVAALPVAAPLAVASTLVDLHTLAASSRARPTPTRLRGALNGRAAREPGVGPVAWSDLIALDPGSMSAAPPSRVARARAQRPVPPIMPLPGEVTYGRGGASPRLQEPGIAIAAAPGQAVAAPEDGRIVFAGAFKSYGLLLIIEHRREYHTLLWGFSRIDVAIGEGVRTGQVVGVMGSRGEGAPELYVELRRNGRPVNPMPWLAASSSKVRG